MKKVIFIVLVNLFAFNMGFAQWQQLKGPSGGSVSAFLNDSLTGNLYAGTNGGGVYISSDKGANWSLIDDRSTVIDKSFIVNCLATFNNRIFAGTNNGLFVLNDTFNGWEYYGAFPLFSQVNTVLVEGSTIYVGTQYHGMYKSLDKGLTWNASNTGLTSLSVKAIVRINNTLFAGTMGGGVYISNDFGVNWEPMNTGMPETSIVISLFSDGNFLYAGTLRDGAYISTNLGNTWSPINNGLPKDLTNYYAVNAFIIFNNTLFTATDKGIYSSIDNGTLWQTASDVLKNSKTFFFAKVDSMLFAGVEWLGVFKSSDNGMNWVTSSNGLSNIIVNKIVFKNGRLFAATQNGLFVSSDNGETWQEKNNGMPKSQISSIVYNDNYILVGSDRGFFLSIDEGDTWISKNIDGAVYSIALQNDTTYVGLFRSILRSTDFGDTWVDISPKEIFYFVNSIAVNDEVLIAGGRTLPDYGFLFISKDRGKTWKTAVQNSINPVNIVKILDKQVFVCTWSNVFRIKNDGDIWEHITTGSFYDIFKKGNSMLIGGSGNNLKYSHNSGKTWEWANPPARYNYNSFAENSDYLYVGTGQAGIFKTRYSDFFRLTVLSDTIIIKGQANSVKSFDLESKFDWSLKSSQSWLKSNIYSGTGDGSITLTADENPMPSKREVTLTIISGSEEIIVHVIQEPGDYKLSLSQSILNEIADPIFGTDITLFSNTKWKAYSDEGWIKINFKYFKEGSETSVLNINILANNSSKPRTGHIVVSSEGGLTQILTINQQGCVDDGVWKQVKGPSVGNISTMVIDPVTKYLYVGTYTGGIYKSIDNGITWNAVNNGLKIHEINSIFWVAGKLIAATQGGLFITENNGENWTLVSNGPHCEVYSLCKNNGGVLFAGTEIGVFISKDNGITWQQSKLITGQVKKITSNNDCIFIIAYRDLYKSNNNGETWTYLSYVSDNIQAITTKGDNIYLGDPFGIEYSSDFGANWTSIKYSKNILSIKFVGTKLIAGTTSGLIASDDNGLNWIEYKNEFSKASINCIESDANKIFLGTNQGVYFSSNYADWASLNKGIYNAQVNYITQIADRLYACTKGAGVSFSNDYGETWTFINNGLSQNESPLSMNVNSIAADGENFYACTDYGIYLSSNQGNLWEWASNDISKGLRINAIAVKENYIFVGTSYGVYKSTNKGKNWMRVGLSDYTINSIDIVDKKVLAGTAGQGAYYSEINGGGWAKVNEAWWNSNVTSITHNGTQIYVGIDYWNSVFYSSSDGGASWLLQANGINSYGLKNIATIEDNVYVAMKGRGVYLSSNTAKGFSPINNGFSEPNINYLKSIGNYVYACSNSSSIWRRLNTLNVDTLFTSKNSISVNYQANNKESFLISSNVNWTASSNQSWLTLNKTSGINNSIIKLALEENKSNINREATIVIKGDGLNPKEVKVVQFASIFSPYLSVIPSNLKINNDANSKASIDIISNINWNANSSESWLTIDKISGSNCGNITLIATANATNSSRSATITISGDNNVLPQIVTVTQMGHLLNVTPNSLEISSSANSIAQFNITSNGKWIITNDQNWLTLSATEGENNKTVFVVANENTSTLTRTAAIKIVAGNISQTVTVMQLGAQPVLVVAPNTISLEASENSNAIFNVSSNINWTVSCNQTWLNLSSTSGANNGTITITANANVLASPRSASITVSGAGVAPQTLIVTQAGVLPFLDVQPSLLSVNALGNSSASFSIKSSVSWTISCNQYWLTTSSKTGIGNSEITVTSLVNEWMTPREAIISITGTGVATRTVKVTQLGALPKLAVSTNSISIDALSSSTASFDIFANVSWSITCDQSWLRFNVTNGDYDQKIYVIAKEENINQTSRSAIVTISSPEGVSQIVTVVQKAASPILIVSPEWLGIEAAENSSGSLSVRANMTWSASSNESWLRLDKTNGVNDEIISVTADANSETSQRSAVVTFIGNGVAPQRVEITQFGSDSIVKVSPLMLTLNGREGSAGSFNVFANLPWSTYCYEPWLTLDKYSGTGNDVISVTASENNTGVGRSTYLIVSGFTTWIPALDIIEIYQEPYNPNLTVSPNQISLGAKENLVENLGIISNISWSITCDKNWLSFSNVSGSGNLNVILTAEANLSFSERTAIITILGLGVEKQIVQITQAASTPILNVAPSELELGSAENSSAVIGIESNIEWSVSSDQPWLKLNSTSGFSNGSVSITATANPEITVRTATLMIFGNGVASKTVLVTQQGAAPVLNITPSELELGSTENSSAVIGVESNIEWSISIDRPWLRLSSTSGFSNGSVSITATANPEIIVRTARLMIFGNGVASKTVLVTQQGAAPVLNITPSELELGSAENSSAVIRVESNIDWSVSIDQAWLSLSSTSGFSNGSITIIATANQGVTARTATLTLAGSGVASKTVLVTQHGAAPVLNITPSELELGSAENSSAVIGVESNIDWSVSIDQSWLRLNSTSGTNSGNITVTAIANPVVASRVATLTVSGIGVANQIIIVTQAGAAPILFVSPTILELGSAANSTATFTVFSNIDWNVTCDQPWLSFSVLSGSGNGSVNLTSAANYLPNLRIATVTVTGKDVDSNSIIVKQLADPTGIDDNGEDGISVYPNPVSDMLTVKVPSTLQNVIVEVYSASGTKLYSSNSSKEEEQIDMSGYKSGLYILRIVTSDKVITKKIVKN